MAELYATHAPPAIRLAYFLTGNSHTAEDLVQDAFVRAFGRFQDLRDPDAFRAYLTKTVVNLSKNYFRHRGVERSFLRRARAWRQESVDTAPSAVVDDEVFRALQALPQRQKAALVLRYYGDLSEHQAANTLGCSVGAVNSLVARGLKTLREQMTGGVT